MTAVGFPCVQGVEQSDGSWQATSLSGCLGNGSHTVSASVTWTNAFGGSTHDLGLGADHGFDPITISNYYGGNQAFDPAAGDIGGGYCLSDAANVTVTVSNSSNTVVRTLQSAVSKPAG